MEKVKVRYTVDRDAAVLAGKSFYGQVVQEIDPSAMTDAQRRELVSCRESDGAYSLDILGTHDEQSRKIWQPVAEAGDDVPVMLLDRRIAIQKARDEAQARKRAEDRERERREILEVPLEKLVIVQDYRLDPQARYAYLRPDPKKWQGDDEVLARLQEAQEYADKRHEVIVAQKEGERLQREALKAAVESWVNEHGSELLKARKAGGFDWLTLSRREYADKVMADAGLHAGYTDQDTHDRTKPSLEEIRALEDIRKRLGGTGEAKLVWLKPEAKMDDYGDETGEYETPWADAQWGIEVEINTPDGNTTWRVVPSVELG